MEKSEEMVTLTMFSLLLLYSLLKVCQKLQENECLDKSFFASETGIYFSFYNAVIDFDQYF